MPRRAADSKLIRRTVGFWAGLRWTLNFWVAMICLVQVYSEGIHRLALTLPVVIIALLDTWREFRAALRVPDDNKSLLSHSEKSRDSEGIGEVSRFHL